MTTRSRAAVRKSLTDGSPGASKTKGSPPQAGAISPYPSGQLGRAHATRAPAGSRPHSGSRRWLVPGRRPRRLGAVKIYTRKGDDGTTGLLYGGRVPKDSAQPTAYGDVDEAQAVLGVARAECARGSELD